VDVKHDVPNRFLYMLVLHNPVCGPPCLLKDGKIPLTVFSIYSETCWSGHFQIALLRD